MGSFSSNLVVKRLDLDVAVSRRVEQPVQDKVSFVQVRSMLGVSGHSEGSRLHQAMQSAGRIVQTFPGLGEEVLLH